MEDKRKIANEELSETINSGILSFVNPEILEFSDLPEITPSSTEAANQAVLNNFNVNVNVSNSSNMNSSSVLSQNSQGNLKESFLQNNTQLIKTAATNAMRNALPTLSGSSEEIKKNSPTILQGSSNQILNETENKIYQNLFSNLMIEDFYMTNNSKTYKEDSSVPILNFNEIGITETPNIENYSYTESPIQTENNRESNQYENFKNIVNNFSLNYHDATSTTPYTSFNTSSYIEEVMGERRIETINNLQVYKNLDNKFKIDNIIPTTPDIDYNKSDNLIKKLQRDLDVSKMNALSDEDTIEATSSSVALGNLSSNASKLNSRNFSHINGPDEEYPIFLTQMNRPPVWRSVLG